MKIAVTGATGGFGSELCKLIESKKPEWELVGLTRFVHDLRDLTGTTNVIKGINPDIVIHAAAMTNVDGCETDNLLAKEVNIEGARAVAEGAKLAGAKMVFISSDYVFDGSNDEPYVESDQINPINYYGMTKQKGEEATLELEGSLVIRSSWLFGTVGSNFVKTMLLLAEKGEPIKVVNDQIGSPTYYPHLAAGVLKAIENDTSGILHITNAGYCSWYDFALEVLKIRGVNIKVTPVTSDEYKTPAKRPKNSRLDCGRYIEIAGEPLPDWRDALKEYLDA